LKNERQKQNIVMKQWNHQRRDRMLIRKKHKEYCNKLKLQKKGAKQYRAMDLAKN